MMKDDDFDVFLKHLKKHKSFLHEIMSVEYATSILKERFGDEMPSVLKNGDCFYSKFEIDRKYSTSSINLSVKKIGDEYHTKIKDVIEHSIISSETYIFDKHFNFIRKECTELDL